MPRDRLESFKEFARQKSFTRLDQIDQKLVFFFFWLIANDMVYIYTTSTNLNRGKARKRYSAIST